MRHVWTTKYISTFKSCRIKSFPFNYLEIDRTIIVPNPILCSYSQKSNSDRAEESKSVYETCKSQDLGPAHGTRTLCVEGFEGEGVAGVLLLRRERRGEEKRGGMRRGDEGCGKERSGRRDGEEGRGKRKGSLLLPIIQLAIRK